MHDGTLSLSGKLCTHALPKRPPTAGPAHKRRSSYLFSTFWASFLVVYKLADTMDTAWRRTASKQLSCLEHAH
jgi:hypothetical protein